MLGVLNILRVLNMSGLHKVLNKIFLDRCSQYSEYSEYVLDSEYATVLNLFIYSLYLPSIYNSSNVY